MTFTFYEDFEGADPDVTITGVGLGSSYDTDSAVCKHGVEAMYLTNCSAFPATWGGTHIGPVAGEGRAGALDVVWSFYFRIEGDNGAAPFGGWLLRQFLGKTNSVFDPHAEFGITYYGDGGAYVKPFVTNSAGSTTYGTPITIARNRWYLLDARTTFSGSNVTIDWMLDEHVRESLTSGLGFATGGANQTYTPAVGNNTPDVGILRVDDWWLENPSTNYPIGPHPQIGRIRWNTAEGQADTTLVANDASNTGGGSGDIFDDVFNQAAANDPYVLTFSDDWSSGGTKSYKTYADGVGTAEEYLVWDTSFGSLPEATVGMSWKLSSPVASTITGGENLVLLNAWSDHFYVVMNDDGTITLTDSSFGGTNFGTSVNSYGADGVSDARLELVLDAGTGDVALRLYASASDTVATETITTSDPGMPNFTYVEFGNDGLFDPNASWYMDDLWIDNELLTDTLPNVTESLYVDQLRTGE